ncbi:hypothetical protein EG19_08000 [Thermoanaerobaculum aquaticum]|uniref:Doubled CXXCH motif domain-containing protein n=1 Tax=Thermoanaerobaculum aquaticum TaxID=1312852 RepID=A0A062XKH7_9BACT|nr:hypothetical protein [Thermoanaerobaculum aquaticum]KDA53047.1 hypothetical protein EG19_08000 [Thermoanaerobaculum aquaticum]BCW93635.1 MAG: hypothetical protein KatS3mg007_1529 [Thermoanaerobaculum sp.]GBC80864.1 hypothetical protein HRbin09_02114 [bacterium HR09]
MPERGRWGLALFLGLLGVFAVLLLASDRAPKMPSDPDHGIDLPEIRCLSCHGYGQKHPRPEDHPLRDDCFSCHRDAQGKLHPRWDAPTSLPGGWRDDPRLLAKGAR